MAAGEAAAASRDRYSVLLLYDVDQDGTVVASEVSDTLDALGTMSFDIGRRNNGIRSRHPETCDMPKPAETDEIIVLSGYEASVLSSVTLAGPDAATQIARLRIEDGARPLYLFVTAFSNVIWDVSGATDRLRTMAVQVRSTPDGIAGGVIGVVEDTLRFVRDRSSVPAYARLEGPEGSRVLQQVSDGLGRAPDLMLSFYTIRQLDLPSGAGMTGQGDGTDIVIHGGRRYELTPDGPRAIDETESQENPEYPG